MRSSASTTGTGTPRLATSTPGRRHVEAYAEEIAFERISVDHRIMGGVPCIRGTRIPVTTIVAMVAENMATYEVLVAFPQLHLEDIQDALRYAAAAHHLIADRRESPLSNAPVLVPRGPGTGDRAPPLPPTRRQ